MQHDISLLRLDEEIQFTQFVNPIALPAYGEEPNANEECAISGWGDTIGEAYF